MPTIKTNIYGDIKLCIKCKNPADVIEKGKVTVQVFEISATYGDVFNGLDAKNKKYDLNNLLKVGSMSEASLNGNWGE